MRSVCAIGDNKTAENIHRRRVEYYNAIKRNQYCGCLARTFYEPLIYIVFIIHRRLKQIVCINIILFRFRMHINIHCEMDFPIVFVCHRVHVTVRPYNIYTLYNIYLHIGIIQANRKYINILLAIPLYRVIEKSRAPTFISL